TTFSGLAAAAGVCACPVPIVNSGASTIASVATNIRAAPSTAARQSPYDRSMDNLNASPASSVPSATRDATPSISITNLDLSLGTGAARVHILKTISLRIATGEAIGLVGASGSGKSTLLMVMAGLERPDSGEVVVNGTSFNA